MDSAIEFVQEIPNPLVFSLGPAHIHEYLKKAFEESQTQKKYLQENIIYSLGLIFKTTLWRLVLPKM